MRVPAKKQKYEAEKLRFPDYGINSTIDDLDDFVLNYQDERLGKFKNHSRIIDVIVKEKIRHKLCLWQDGSCGPINIFRHRGLSGRREMISSREISDHPILRSHGKREFFQVLWAPKDGALSSGFIQLRVSHRKELVS